MRITDMSQLSMEETPNGREKLMESIREAETVVIGAGAGTSTAAGYDYAGDRFACYFGDFARKYGIRDMYSGGFFRFASPQEQWAYWSRFVYINRYMDPPKRVYPALLDLVKDKDYFVLTTNVDHCFQKAGFDKQRLFYTQGDYGLFQCAKPCHQATYDNGEQIREMLLAQGLTIDGQGNLHMPETGKARMEIPERLIPRCPVCGERMGMNLRADASFVEDAGWHLASERYARFIQTHEDTKTVFLEIGTGWNTPGIIKFNFWQLTEQWKNATYACVNFGEAMTPKVILDRSICINDDLADVLGV